jgi:hypothetical protein
MNEREAAILRRAELLELEAQVQRATLAATLKQWEQKKMLTYATGVGSVALSLLRVPKIRWLLLGSVIAKIRKKKEKDRHKDGD